MDGNGTFASTPLATLTQSFPLGINSGDFDGKNGPDLAVTSCNYVTATCGTNTVSIYLNNGSGNFFLNQVVAAGSGPAQVVVDDLNGDGKKDIAVSNFDSDNVSVALGNGNGTFQGAANFAAGNGPYHLRVRDYNRDGIPDIAVENANSDNVSVLTGNGDGTFDSPANFPVANQPFGLATEDFDKKNGPDLATANFSSNNISVLLNSSTPSAGSLSLTKTDSRDPVTVGQNLTYQLTVTNSGSSTASSVTITDTLPTGTTFVSASSGCTNTSNTVTCNVGSLANGATATVIPKLRRGRRPVSPPLRVLINGSEAREETCL